MSLQTMSSAPVADTNTADSSLPLVSVIVPVYNTGAYLVDAVNSVVAQTYPRLELIIVDDASTDALTLKLLAAYEQIDVLTPDNVAQVTAGIDLPLLSVNGEFPKEIVAIKDALKHPVSMIPDTQTKVQVHVVHAYTNQGIGGARNLGISASTGSYLLFLDSDDVLAPQLIEHVYKTKISTDADVVGFICHNFSYDPKCDLSVEPLRWNVAKNKLLLCEDLIKEQQLFNVCFCAYCWLLPRQAIVDHKIFFAPNVIFEDNDWVVRLVLNTKSIYCTGFDGYGRLLHASQITAVDARGARVVNIGDAQQRVARVVKASPYYALLRNSCIDRTISAFYYRANNLKEDLSNKKQILQELFARVAGALELLDVPVSRKPSFLYMQWHHLLYKLPWLSEDARKNHFVAVCMARLYRRYCK